MVHCLCAACRCHFNFHNSKMMDFNDKKMVIVFPNIISIYIVVNAKIGLDIVRLAFHRKNMCAMCGATQRRRSSRTDTSLKLYALAKCQVFLIMYMFMCVCIYASKIAIYCTHRTDTNAYIHTHTPTNMI